MTKKTKKNSAMKKLIPAIGMLAISGMMLASSTYAWFSMSKDVSVTGMKLQATAEDGLVITDKAAKTDWATSKDINMTAGVSLAPVSTDGAVSPAWAFAKSANFDNADKNQDATGAYTDLTLSYTAPTVESGGTSTANGANFGTGEGIGAANGVNYVLKKDYWIKATGQAAWNSSLVVDEVTAAGISTSGNLDKALRVLVVASSGQNQNAFIYAPVTGYDNACKFKNGENALTLVAATTDSTCTNITSIPIANDDAIHIEMYLYFEGEDANCKSSNISGITVDTLTVSAKFKTLASGADAASGGGNGNGGANNGEGGNGGEGGGN